ncbi:MAG: TerC family protein [Bacteroidetes bacterium]|nr:TerC family protein [Bacteroidota bacterium]
MEHLFNLDALISLLTLTTLEIVLGIDNVIFVSILMGSLPDQRRLAARRLWMFLGITTRILLLMALGWLVRNGSRELFGLDLGDRHVGFNLRNVIMFAGGLFLLYKTVKEIHSKLEGEEPASGVNAQEGSFALTMGQIILVDMVFSFDSIITAVGMARHVEVMAAAVIIAMVIMFYFAENISRFIHKHPTLKMLALSFLLMVGFSLFFEGLEPIHDSHIDKAYIYVAMAFSFGVELLNMRMRRKMAGTPAIELREPHLKD